MTDHPRAHLIGNPRSKLWLTAIHEAGHAVVCLAAGGTFRHVTIRSSDGGLIAGHVDGSGYPTPRLAAVGAAAGALAQVQADRGPNAGHRARAGMGYTGVGDLADLVELGQDKGVDLNAAMESAMAAVYGLYPLIEVAATALMSPKALRALKKPEIVDALDAQLAPWIDAAERLLEVETVHGTAPEGWLIRYVEDGMSRLA
jgi:hypothetical protein